MQQSIGIKQLMVNHLAATALAATIVVSVVLGVAGLSASGSLPWSADDDGTGRAVQIQGSASVAQIGASKEARQSAFDIQAGVYAARAAAVAQAQRATAHKEASMDAEFVALTALPTQAQRVATVKESRLAAQEQQRSEIDASTKRHETMQRYFAHKEAQLDALP